MSKNADVLSSIKDKVPSSVRQKIDDALDGPTPCARCNKIHPLKECPMNPNDGQKGSIWKPMHSAARKNADAYLRSHAKYKPTASVSSPAANTLSHLAVRPNIDSMSKQPVSKQSVSNQSTSNQSGSSNRPVVAPFRNDHTSSSMHYPLEVSPDSRPSSSTGKAWAPAKSMSKVISDPLFPIRQSFFQDQPRKPTIITNHFEYELKTETFYEYRIKIKPEIKNRRRRKELFEAALTHWPFLQLNEDNFATNAIDTVVSWKPLHLTLEKGTREWSQDIPVANKQPIKALFQFVSLRNVNALRQYASANPNYEGENFEALTGDITRCLNIVISKGFGNNIHKVSSNKFFVKTARSSLSSTSLLYKAKSSAQINTISNQLELIRGYYYNVKPGMGNIIFNFNICTSAVFRPITIAEFLNQDNTFEAVGNLESLLKGKTVYLTLERDDKDPKKKRFLNEEKARYWNVFEIQDNGNIEDLFFETGEGSNLKTVKVIDHLQTISASNVRPTIGRPAVNVGTRHHKIWYAQEHLRLVPFQSYNRPLPPDYAASMVKQACRSPGESRILIEKEGLPSMGFTVGNVAESFGSNVPVTLVPMMLRVPYQELAIPAAHYIKQNKDQSEIEVSIRPQSHWKFPHSAHRFFETSSKTTIRYALLLGPGVQWEQATVPESQLTERFAKLNISPQGGTKVVMRSVNNTEMGMRQTLKSLKNGNIDIVFLLLQKPDIEIYLNFKNAADRLYAMQSVCMTLKKDSAAVHIIDRNVNIMMKVNLKLGGINHRVEGVSHWLKNTMVIGADLVHPGPGSFPGTPSIAAIVGSVDPNGGKCLGSLRLQNNMKDDREIIDQDTLEEMVKDRLTAWKESHDNDLPDNIIYFRDGVSSSHYRKVCTQELEAIKEAYRSARKDSKGKPKNLNLTVVVVTKRHHTRFYPLNEHDGDRYGNGNTKPGTCVDKLVTSPYYQDFFLQSHSGIKGTARPTHYFVLENSIPGMTLPALRDLTYQLCYSYVRSMSGVSYVSPTYYADRLCERGRLYIRKFYNGDDADLRKKLDDAKIEVGQMNFDKADEKKELNKRIKKITWDAIYKEFYNQPPNPDPKYPGRIWKNPYAYGLRNTMF